MPLYRSMAVSLCESSARNVPQLKSPLLSLVGEGLCVEGCRKTPALPPREMEGGETVMRNFTQNEVHGSETAPVATRLAENSIFVGLGKHTC